MAVKDWILIIGVTSLVLERLILWIFKLIRPEKEIDSIAMDMVKLHDKGDWTSTPLAHFYFYKKALKKGTRYNKNFVRYIENKEREISRRLEQLEFITNNTYAIMTELEYVMSDLKKQEKLPEELKKFFYEVESLVAQNREAMKYRPKIQEILDKVFRKNKDKNDQASSK